MTVYHLKKSEPEFLLSIPDHIIEKACAAYWDTGLYPGQLKWTDLVQREDHRVSDIRLAIHAALSVTWAELEPAPDALPCGLTREEAADGRT